MTHLSKDLKTRPSQLWRGLLWGAALGLWITPLVAMQFTAEVQWDLFDFVLWGAMLAVACGLYEFATRLSGSLAYRAGAALALITGFVLVWMNLAVGIIGSEDNPANLMFAGVILMGLVGAACSRFKAKGLCLTLITMAGAQVLIAIIVILNALDARTRPIVVMTTAFTLLWLMSAWLFRQAGRRAERINPS